MSAVDEAYGPPEPHPHWRAVVHAWDCFTNQVREETAHLSDDDFDCPNLPVPLAWVCAVWQAIRWQFIPYNLERLFFPVRSERRQLLSDLTEQVYICGGDNWTEVEWAAAEELAAEFGRALPPRDWQPMSVVETVGYGMGMTREELEAITGEPLPVR